MILIQMCCSTVIVVPSKFKLQLLTYSMVQSPSWEANWLAASQEIPRISRNPKVHYRTHKRPPHFSILGQPNPVHIPTSHLLEIHPNIIHPSTPRSPQWSPSLRFPHQDPIHHPLLTHTRHRAVNICLKKGNCNFVQTFLSYLTYAKSFFGGGGAFAKLSKTTISFISVCLSVRPHGTVRLRLDELSWNLVREFLQNLLREFKFH